MKSLKFIPYDIKAKILLANDFLSKKDLYKSLKLEVCEEKRIGATYMLLASLLQHCLREEEDILFNWDIHSTNIVSHLKLLEKKVDFYLSLIFKIDYDLLIYTFKYLLEKDRYKDYKVVSELIDDGASLVKKYKEKKEKEIVINIKQSKKA